MANIILFDNEVRDRLLPLTFTRPVCELRIGLLTIREKWQRWLGGPIAYITQDYLAERYEIDHGKDNLIINGSVLPSAQLVRLIQQMDFNEAYLQGEELIVAKLGEEQIERLMKDDDISELKGYDLADTEFLKVDYPWDLYRLNGQAIEEDFELLTKGRSSAPLSESNRVVGDRRRVFLEEGATAECAVFNTEGGPVYLGRNAKVMEGCLVRGAFGLCDHGTLKMGAKIYGATTVGPHCKVGGEVNNSILTGYSNKGHDGFLGNAVLGHWCNLGADTNNSNLKNNYDQVRLWSYAEGKFIKTGQQFCGLFMGDHSKTGINTMLNTGTVIGVSANVFGEGFPRNFIPSFSWGGKQGFQTYRTDKAFETMERVMQRRNVALDVQERLMLLRIFEDTRKYRSWEKRD
jgi:UDP-N-acetylglucosamine diphosphorylase/glucosamine-1-phosphate N-acetyltransferase